MEWSYLLRLRLRDNIRCSCRSRNPIFINSLRCLSSDDTNIVSSTTDDYPRGF